MEVAPNGDASTLTSSIPVASDSIFQVLLSSRTEVSRLCRPDPGLASGQYSPRPARLAK